jgi:hypothetical protein
MQAFQLDAFQENAFQDANAGAPVPAFQRCAFQFGAFQVLPCRDTQSRPTGGIIRRKKPAKDFAEPQTQAERDDERERLGIIPRRVKSVISRVAKESIDKQQSDEQSLRRELRAELLRERLAYEVIYLDALLRRREQMVSDEIRALLSIEKQQQEWEQYQRQMSARREEVMRRDEEDIAFLLMFS